MKNLICILFAAIVFLSCTSTKKGIAGLSTGNSYLIKKIGRKNSWYIIYAKRKDTLYKIVSKADNTIQDSKKIIVGQLYEFDLQSHKKSAPVINGVKIDPVGYTGCYQFDKVTTICLEPKLGIYDLFYTVNLKGLCYFR